MPQGKVKWFNNAKGYGFIIEDGCSEDLFAHFSSIQMEGYKTLKAGQSVSFDKQPSGKGIHAVNICSLEMIQPHGPDASVDDEIISVEEEQHMARHREDAAATGSEKETSETKPEKLPHTESRSIQTDKSLFNGQQDWFSLPWPSYPQH